MMKRIALFSIWTLALTAADTGNLTGTWTLSLIGDHVFSVGMELTQEASKVKGTLMMPQGDYDLDGQFEAGQLTLTGTQEMPDGKKGTLKFTAKMNDDGTLAGEFATNHGNMKWSAERFKKRAK